MTKTIPHFTNGRVGVVQPSLGSISNHNYSFLLWLQSLWVRCPFLRSNKLARSAAGSFMKF
ncbi:MAG: hypothetical protein U5K54_21145 [Cytophagales bacterium]|nr:hypothetical protein [Cytophagales bacterium]